MGRGEHLADELKQLVGWQVHPRRLSALPTLLAVAEVDTESASVAGFAARRFLVDGVTSFASSFVFEGQTIDPERARIAFRLLLGLEGSHQSAPVRRGRVITLLRLSGVTVDQWRRPFGLEREFLGYLADHLVASKRALASC